MNILSISKFRATIAALALVLAASAPAAHAQRPDHSVKVNVPFAFVVNNAQLPAGQYTISELNDRVLQVRGGSTSVLFLTRTGDSSAPFGRGKIVFHRYGDQYFLHAIARQGASSTKDCIESKAEKQARKSMLAANQAKSNSVQVTLAEVHE